MHTTTCANVWVRHSWAQQNNDVHKDNRILVYSYGHLLRVLCNPAGTNHRQPALLTLCKDTLQLTHPTAPRTPNRGSNQNIHMPEDALRLHLLISRDELDRHPHVGSCVYRQLHEPVCPPAFDAQSAVAVRRRDEGQHNYAGMSMQKRDVS